jgi:hypothetical protein
MRVILSRADGEGPHSRTVRYARNAHAGSERYAERLAEAQSLSRYVEAELRITPGVA